MRRLDILLAGSSPALAKLSDTLAAHGHGLYLASSHEALQAYPVPTPHVVIDDGSLALTAEDRARLAGCAYLSLRLGSSPTARGHLPTLELLCWTGSATAQRLIERQALAAEPSGNGQQLRLRVFKALLEMVERHVSRCSRNPEYLEQAAVVGPMQQAQEHGLHWLESLAFIHPFNNCVDTALLRHGQTPVIARLADSLVTFAAQTALIIDGEPISYAQLHAQALAIQQQLLALLPPALEGEPPPVVALCLPKSLALYASLLAVLGCAAVYLPLDPAHPTERLSFILDNAKVAVLVHDGQFDGGRAMNLPRLDLRHLPTPIAPPLASLMQRQPGADAPCVAIYTSGTTGQPKGVLLSQRNLSHFQGWYAARVELDAVSRVLQFSTINFDASLLDILPTWVCGGQLIIPDEDQRRDPAQLLALMQREQVSHAFLPPALLSVLALQDGAYLRHLVTGGDVCEPEIIERLGGHCRLHNIYGPTETTVLATTRVFAPGDSNRNLGYPLPNTQVLILDEQQQPVPQHTAGELYIAGPGVGLGYLHNPALTAERFVSLALADGEAVRAYRTGDIGQWTGDGIEICGRRDNQVKIRGFRVEPEEIEHCLRNSRLFAQVAVVIDAQRRVLAFLAQPRVVNAETALRRHAEQTLPDYMRPLLYQVLAAMPFTANGKVDRRALLELPLNLRAATPRQLPSTALEQQLLSLWSELLELPPADISTDDSFFNLGGHSILLSRLLLAIREQFGRGISINRFIETPTLQRLATLVGGAAQVEASVDPQALRDALRELPVTPLPVSRLGDPHKVIVTGANSFLGVHIVEALLDWGATEVACLVRRNSQHSAAQRFAQALAENHLQGLDMSRVRVLEADLRQPRLGLAEADYDDLDSRYGALVHNAALVNHVLDYAALAADNIEPLFECLRLCEGRTKKLFNFVSTLSACSARDSDGRVLETAPAATPPIYIRNGYNVSKWVGERVLERARQHGVWVNLFRPGNITFDSRSGACQPHKNRLMLMLKGSLQLGQVPALEQDFDLMPVDFLARFIAFHSSGHRPEAAVFNLHNPEPLRWSTYVEAFRDFAGPFEQVSVAQWQRQLQRVDRDNALFDVLGFYLDGFEEDIGDISQIDHSNARAGVQRMGTRYPQKNPALLQRGCRYLKNIQFI